MKKKVVITGAANGIGRAAAMACLAEDFYVIAADKDVAGLESLLAEAGSDRLEVIGADFADLSTLKTFIPQLYARHESLSGLVNNAGIYHGQSVFDYSDAQIDEMYTVNLKSLIYLSRDFARREMSSGGTCSIVNVTSVAGEVGSLDALYGATKAGVIGLTKANAWNFAPSIRVNAVSPALVRNTSIFNRIPEHRRREYERQEILKEPIQPSGVADVIVFLLGEKSRHLTGQVIAVDNGAYPR
ncbi:SDR family oxidoreductase [Pseudomonas sp. G.S.17]|uniref:SDR family NAD(P)-dependent oxidoreductase n=1 Tax=Pseudomonas sp. G.S.17 TaxID=3137451 RepID=UPI00311C9EBD